MAARHKLGASPPGAPGGAALQQAAADVECSGPPARASPAAPAPLAPSTLNATKGHVPQASPRGALWAAALYMASAIALTFLNKATLSVYGFKHIRALTAMQMVFQLACLAPLRASGQVSFWKGAPPPQYAGATYLPLEVLRRCAVLAGAFMAYLLVGMLAVDGVNVPMYTTLRRTAVAFTMCAEYLLAGQRFGRPVVAAVAVIVAGSLVAGAADMDFNPVGYGWVFAANAATAVYLSVIARLSRQLPLSSFGLMWANAVLCMPGLTAWLYFSGEAAAVARFEHLHETDFQMALLGSCGLAFVINFAIFLNTQLNTAVTQSVCGNLKDIGTVFIGFFAFGGVRLVAANVLGIAVSIAGSVYYAYIKLSSPVRT